MIERFLLDRIDAKPAGAPIAEEPHASLLGSPNEAEAALSVFELAGARAHVALHARAVEHVPVLRLDDRAVSINTITCHASHPLSLIHISEPTRLGMIS